MRAPRRCPRVGRLVIGIVGAVVAVSCAKEVTRADLDEAVLRADEGASPIQASCIVDELVAIYGLDGVQTEMKREAPTHDFQTDRVMSQLRCGYFSAFKAPAMDTLMADGADHDQAQCVTTGFVSSITDSDIDHMVTGQSWDGFPVEDKWFDALEACGLWP